MSPHKERGTGTCHTVETVDRERDRGWQRNCLGDGAATTKKPEKCLLYVCHATIHKHVEFRHMRICVDTADY